MVNHTRHRLVAAASVLCLAIAAPVLAVERNTDDAKGIVDLTTSYGASGAIASVVGVSGATDRIQVTFAQPMHAGNFGMGVNFAKSWTKTWNADNTVLTIGGDLDFKAATAPALIVYLMQTEADRKDISEPNIFKFQDVALNAVKPGNGQINLDFDILYVEGEGYGDDWRVFMSKSADGAFKRYDYVDFNAKGAQIKGLDNGQTYWFYLEYKRKGLVATRTETVAVSLPKRR
ncbi:MAG TPA: hypothetical protein VMF52_08395 [Steroidobacteraceae bacterium]|nr:hypothetical protein [Steroidobacteraceae bacterium]